MARSFGLVDEKLAEADFFLERLLKSEFDFFATRCFFNAFVSAARSVTFSLQAVMGDKDGFTQWYAEKQKTLRSDRLASFFVKARNATQKVGEQPVTGGSTQTSPDGTTEFTWKFSPTGDLPEVPQLDVATACRAYLSDLVSLILDCYQKFGPTIDPEQHYTPEHFASMELTIDDADQEVFGVRGWTSAPGIPEATRWQMLRDSVAGCDIDDLFEKYTGRARPRPDRIVAPAQTGRGWVHIPDAVRQTGNDDEDIQLYIESLRRARDTGRTDDSPDK